MEIRKIISSYDIEQIELEEIIDIIYAIDHYRGYLIEKMQDENWKKIHNNECNRKHRLDVLIKELNQKLSE